MRKPTFDRESLVWRYRVMTSVFTEGKPAQCDWELQSSHLAAITQNTAIAR